MKIDGSCHCGAIAYEAEIDPAQISICHCIDCQQLTGTAFRVTCFAPEADFTLTRGEPTMYLKTTADSGNPREQYFCGHCGSQLWTSGRGTAPKIYGIRVGSARQRAELQPTRQIWRHSALDWLDNISSLPAQERDG